MIKKNFLKIKLKQIVLCMSIVGLFSLSGCVPVTVFINEIMEPPGASCMVNSVDGTNGNHEYICKNDAGTYIYHEDGIYNYETMLELVEVEDLEYMACNNDVLYYSNGIGGGELYCYDFEDETTTLVMDEYRVVGMKAYGDDIFMLQRTKEGIEYGMDEYSYELMYYHAAEEGININEWASRQTPNECSDVYNVYEFNGYRIVEDLSIERDLPQIVFVENEVGFQYSCYRYHTYGKTDDRYIRLARDVKYRYKEEKEITEINELGEEHFLTGFPGLSASQIGFFDNKIYMLVQYGIGASKYQENPSSGCKLCDALFSLNPETGECELIYQVKKHEQIAGFSEEKNCVYLLRDGAVYRYDLGNNTEELILQDEGFDRLIFEYFDDELFVFSESSSSQWVTKFVGVVE